MQRGITLIETLAVVAILALASSLALVSVAGADEAGALRRAVLAARDFDARVRLLARNERVVELVMSSDGTAIEARDPMQPEAAPILRLDLPRGVTGSLEWDPSDALPEVDRRGRSADYRLALRRGDASREMIVRGLTGQVILAGDEISLWGGGPR